MNDSKHLSCSPFPPAVTVEFDPTSYTVSESDRYANITVVRLGQTTQTVSVNFSTADDSATGKRLFIHHSDIKNHLTGP